MSVSLSVDLPEAQAPEEGTSNFRWGTVTNSDPFTVRLDGDSVPLGAVPDSLIDPVNLPPGTRVWVQLFARRVLVLGSSRGIGVGGGGGGGGLTSEQIQDLVATMILEGTNVTKVYNDTDGTLTLSAAGGTSYTDEQVRDVISTALVEGSGISIVKNDAGDTITISSTGGGGEGSYEATLPAGTITAWTSDVAPTNWLICDGSAISRTDYPSLFSALGTRYGAGDGATTFNLPNLKGRVPVGRDAAQTEFDTMGETGGAKTHTLTAAETPTLTGGVTIHGSENGTNLWAASGAFATSAVKTGSYKAPPASTAGANSVSTLNFNNGGSDDPHNNLQPYHVVTFIIKASAGETPGDSELTTRVSDLEMATSPVPAGTINLWAGETAPTNWLLCDGTAVSRTVYASLFAAVGTKYGVGDGSTTFNVPNLKGRTPVGKDASQTEFDNLGETGGSNTSSHSHPLSDAGQAAIALSASATNQIQERRVASANYTNTHTINRTELGGGASGFSGTGAVGAALLGNTDSTSVSRLQPYQVVNFIIKAVDGYTPGDSPLAERVAALESQVSASVLALRDKSAKMQRVLSGGGIRQVETTGVSWTERFIVIGSGVDEYSPSGYFSIEMPANGTVIPLYSNLTVSTQTVTAGKIPLTTWGALYYDPPLGEVSTSDPSRFKLVSYNNPSAPFVVPPQWILICSHNNDTLAARYMWGDGFRQDVWRVFTLGASWVDFGTPYIGHQWKFGSDGSIQLRGLIKNGTFSTSVAVAAWSTSMAPVDQEIFICASSTGHARVDIKTNGDLLMYAAYNTGSNAWVSLAGVSWFPVGV